MAKFVALEELAGFNLRFIWCSLGGGGGGGGRNLERCTGRVGGEGVDMRVRGHYVHVVVVVDDDVFGCVYIMIRSAV